ncbi:MAG: hypothetical protein OXD47_01630 [Gammaproteobacteria bacterium]|nr:hypothetical protein [Gammaproteobacteria bacterium]MCY4282787.1 hypothetical protein [Gammaproteobacteria bacterium]MCY4337481.1 hypothetical protein [Gammaproteobacteria bacterium]
MDIKPLIIVEGKEDLYFLQSYLRYLSPDFPSVEWLEINGKGNLVKSNIQRKLLQGGMPVIIFDADSDYKNTLRQIQDTLVDLSFEVFLFPDNRSAGILENLLEQIIHPEHEDIFICFENYKKCLGEKQQEYEMPNIKGKIYSYKEALGVIKEHEKHFHPEYWDFNSVALKPLKGFLLKNIL